MKTYRKRLKKASEYFRSYESIPSNLEPKLNLANPIKYYFQKPTYFKDLEFDHNGVALWWNNNFKKLDYHLTVITDLSLHNLYKIQSGTSQCPTDFDQLSAQVTFLIKNQIKCGNSKGAWMTNLPQYFSSENLPYLNSSAISRCISVLLRHWLLTGNELSRNAAENAILPFSKMVDQGGVVSELLNGSLWFEAYPTCSGCHVINGHCQSLIGLYDLYVLTGNQKAFNIFNNGIESLLISAPLFDTGRWIRYGLEGYSKHDMSIGYMLSLIDFYRLFYLITKDVRFELLLNNIVGYLKSPKNRSFALANKTIWRLKNVNRN